MLICQNITYKNLAFRKRVAVYKDIVPSVIFDGCRFVLERERLIWVSQSCFGIEKSYSSLCIFVKRSRFLLSGCSWLLANNLKLLLHIWASYCLVFLFFISFSNWLNLHLFQNQNLTELKTLSSGKPINQFLRNKSK